MTMQLAIGYLSGEHRKPRGAAGAVLARSGGVTEGDSVSDRPAIPQAVITWSDAELRDDGLPAGAGDPAVGIDGPAAFIPLAGRRPKRFRRGSIDAVMFGALVVMLLGLGGALGKAGTQPNVAWAPRDMAALAAMGRQKAAVVDVDITRLEPAASPAASPVAAATLASTAKPASPN